MVYGTLVEELFGAEHVDTKAVALLGEALTTHSGYSACKQWQLSRPSFERLEWLGDSVLDYVASRWLFFKHPDKNENEYVAMALRVSTSEPCRPE